MRNLCNLYTGFIEFIISTPKYKVYEIIQMNQKVRGGVRKPTPPHPPPPPVAMSHTGHSLVLTSG